MPVPTKLRNPTVCGWCLLMVPDSPPLLGVLGAWMTFKKPDMDKTLKNALSMNETDPLNHTWLDFAI